MCSNNGISRTRKVHSGIRCNIQRQYRLSVRLAEVDEFSELGYRLSCLSGAKLEQIDGGEAGFVSSDDEDVI